IEQVTHALPCRKLPPGELQCLPRGSQRTLCARQLNYLRRLGRMCLIQLLMLGSYLRLSLPKLRQADCTP
ncbi:hypothetical protein SB759_33925, partial [Pseudomonas sp. SIMBA_059]